MSQRGGHRGRGAGRGGTAERGGRGSGRGAYGGRGGHSSSERGNSQTRGPALGQVTSGMSSLAVTMRPGPVAIGTSTVDKVVTGEENLRVSAPKTKTASFPPRSGYGTLGRPITLLANYFLLKPEGGDLYRYAISAPEGLSRPKRRRLAEYILADPRLSKVMTACDYAGILVTTGDIAVWEADLSTVISSEKGSYKIQETGRFSLTQLVEALKQRSPSELLAVKDEMTQLLNIVVGSLANRQSNVYRLGQDNKFFTDQSPPGEGDLSGGLRALRGFYASVRCGTSRLLLNINVCNAAFFKPQPLVDLMREVRPQDLPALIRLLKVETQYLKGKRADGTVDPRITVKKVKTIIGLGKSPRDQIFEVEGVKTNVHDYFAKQHGIQLKLDLPCVNVGRPDKPIYIPSELCTVMRGQAVRRILNANQTKEMILTAARAPNLNAHFIQSEGLDMYDVQRLATFGIKIDKRMIAVQGRILQAPTIAYGGATMVPKEGSWNLIGKHFFRGTRFKHWAVMDINFGPRKSLDTPRETVTALMTAFKASGVLFDKFPDRHETTLQQLTQTNREANFTVLQRQIAAMAAKGVEICLVVLREADRWLYSRIKYLGDVVHGVQTVCCVSAKLQKVQGQAQYFANIAMKFNTKGGGINHTTRDALKYIDESTMLVGIDVTHPAPGSAESAPSVAGVVANTSKLLGQWPASIRCQESRKEMVTDLADMIVERLTAFRSANSGKLPKRVIVYRDGVSEGQLRIVVNQEIPSFRQAFSRLYGAQANWPKMAMIVVSKRHHTRFYPTSAADAQGKNVNCAPGTVVDRGVTDSGLNDFFLTAQAGLQGSSRPGRYILVHDEIGLSANDLQQGVFELSHVYVRATKAVSICPPAYYADLLCERARLYQVDQFYEVRGQQEEPKWNGKIHSRIANSTFYI
ncbi:hypothetical protein PYCC9005_001732 [Savitreella phatthalungensis]